MHMSENFKDNKKVKYYTGLQATYSVLNALFEYLTEDLGMKLPNVITSAKKSVFEQFVATGFNEAEA